MPKLLRSALRDEVGATAIEYALIASIISVVIVTVWALIGNAIQETFSQVAALL